LAWQDGCSANTYAMTSSMPAPWCCVRLMPALATIQLAGPRSSKQRFLRVADGDILILPQDADGLSSSWFIST